MGPLRGSRQHRVEPVPGLEPVPIRRHHHRAPVLDIAAWTHPRIVLSSGQYLDSSRYQDLADFEPLPPDPDPLERSAPAIEMSDPSAARVRHAVTSIGDGQVQINGPSCSWPRVRILVLRVDGTAGGLACPAGVEPSPPAGRIGPRAEGIRVIPVALTISASAGADGPVVVLSGEADMTTTEMLREMLATQLGTGARLVTVDASELSFLDSASLRILVLAARALQARHGTAR